MAIFGLNGKGYIYTDDAESPVNFTTNYVVDDWLTTSGAHGLSVGDLLIVSSTGTLPGGLSANYYYSVSEVISTTDIYVTAEGTDNVALSSDGTGTHSLIAYKTRTELDNYFVLKDEPEEKGFFIESELDFDRAWVTKGYHWRYEIKIHIYKVGGSGAVRTAFKNLHSHLYTGVWLYRRIDSTDEAHLFRDANGDPVKFIMDKFIPDYVTQTKYQDVVTIGFTSKSFIDLTKMT